MGLVEFHTPGGDKRPRKVFGMYQLKDNGPLSCRGFQPRYSLTAKRGLSIATVVESQELIIIFQ